MAMPAIDDTNDDSGGEPDDALIARVAAGDRSAWPELVDRHLQPIWSCAWRMLGDRAEAEDVAQETFIRLMKKAEGWRPGGTRLTTWLHRVAINLCIDRRRRPALPEYQPERVDAEYDHDAVARRIDITRAVRRALAGLPARQRTALVLVHYQGLTAGETAAALDTSVEAVESLLARARRAVRKTVEPLRADLLENGE